VQPAGDFEQAALLRAVPVESAEPVEKAEGEVGHDLVVPGVRVVLPRFFEDETHRAVRGEGGRGFLTGLPVA